MKIYFSIPWDTGQNIGNAYNQFMQMVPFDEDFACFLDGDATFLTTDFGKQLEDIVNKYPECGLFTCLTNRVKNKKQVAGDWKSNDIEVHRKIAGRLHKLHYDEIEDIADIAKGSLSGVVILIRKSLWRKLGGFTNGMLGVDNDIHQKAYANFEKVYLMKGVYVYHWYRGGDMMDVSHLPPKTAVSRSAIMNRRRELLESRRQKNLPKKIVYSAITGNYDNPLPHKLPNGWEYRLYSNTPGVGTHQVENNGLSDVKLARHIKIMPWDYFDFDVCVWIDGNTIFQKDELENLCQYDFTISTHPERNCIYDEAAALESFGKENVDLLIDITDRYKEEGFPKQRGLVASHAIIRKNTVENKEFCKKWWHEVKNNSHRDQMSFDYVLWKNPLSIHYIKFNTIFRRTTLHKNGVRKATVSLALQNKR